MKKMLVALVTVCALLGLTAAMAAPTNVGVVDMRLVLQKSPQIQAMNDKLKTEFQAREQKVVAARDQLKKDSDNLKKNASVMSNKDREALQQKVQDESKQLTQMQLAFQQDIISAQNQEMETFVNQVKGVMDNIAKQNNLDLILDKSTTVYAANGLDITDQVIKDISK